MRVNSNLVDLPLLFEWAIIACNCFPVLSGGLR
jgi:hypothetical protein